MNNNTPDTINEHAWAWGFDHAFRQLKSRDARYELRHILTSYFGSNGSYYRYRYGQKAMSPGQLRFVERLFRHWGFTGSVADSTAIGHASRPTEPTLHSLEPTLHSPEPTLQPQEEKLLQFYLNNNNSY